MAFNFIKKNVAFIVFCILVVLFIACLIPIATIASFNYPSADDFSSSLAVKTALENGEGFWGAITGIFNFVKTNYLNWQGTFFGLFLMALNPLGYNASGLTIHPIFFVISLVFGVCFLMRSFAKICLLEKNPFVSLSIGLVVSLYLVQFVPRAVDAFFWFTGAVLYTFVFSLSLILFGGALRVLKTTKFLYLNVSLVCVFSFLLASGNYINSVLNTMVLFFIAVYGFFLTKNSNEKHAFKIAVAIFLSNCFGFLITVVAPGNFVRLQLGDVDTNATFMSDVVVRSVKLMFETALLWTGLPLIILCLALVPIFLHIVKKQQFKFKLPLLFIAVFFVCVTALWMPYLFPYIGVYIAYDTALRITNIIFFSYIFFVVASVYYLVGYCYNFLVDVFKGESFSFFDIMDIISKKYLYKLLLLWYGFVVAGVALWFVVSNPIGLTSVSAALDLKDGTAIAYNNEQQLLFGQLNDPDIKDVEIDDFTVFPYLLWSYESNTKPAHWTHWLPFIKTHYNKNSITVN